MTLTTTKTLVSSSSSSPYEGMWDFDGSCAPPEHGPDPYHARAMQQTFTLGCFQWVRRGKDGQGKGLKKGHVQYRVKGRNESPAEAYATARAYCAKKNAENAPASEATR